MKTLKPLQVTSDVLAVISILAIVLCGGAIIFSIASGATLPIGYFIDGIISSSIILLLCRLVDFIIEVGEKVYDKVK